MVSVGYILQGEESIKDGIAHRFEAACLPHDPDQFVLMQTEWRVPDDTFAPAVTLITLGYKGNLIEYPIIVPYIAARFGHVPADYPLVTRDVAEAFVERTPEGMD